jgi:cyclic pyranopterin phosphate synthase
MTSTAVMESADPFAPIVDRFGRVFTYLRVSVNEKCNLRCRYCMPEEGVPLSPDEDLMSADDIARLVAVFARCGGRKVRLTGGEPLLRKDIVEIVRRVAATLGIRSVHLTTNGLLLDKRLDELRAAGLTGLNVSLDSLDDARFAEITRRAGGPAVRAALARAIATGFPSIKINVVALRGLNDDELGDFVEWTRTADVGIRFIELMPFDDHQIWKTGRFIKADWIVERLRELYPNLEPAEGSSTEHHVFRVPGWRGRFAVIPSYSRDLCGACNRIRVTADGRIRNCLYGAEEFEVGSLLRGGADEAVAARLREAMLAKARDGWEAQHRAETVRVEHVRTSMTQIGG